MVTEKNKDFVTLGMISFLRLYSIALFFSRDYDVPGQGQRCKRHGHFSDRTCGL